LRIDQPEANVSNESASVTDNDGDANRTFRSFGCAYVAQLLKDPVIPEPTRIVEFGVNVTDGVAFPWNPYECNFTWQSDAEDAARQYLRDNPDTQSAVVFELVIEDNQIISDRTMIDIDREDVVLDCVPI